MQYAECPTACQVMLKIQEFRKHLGLSFLSENVSFIKRRTVLKVRELLNILATKEENGQNTSASTQLAVGLSRNMKKTPNQQVKSHVEKKRYRLKSRHPHLTSPSSPHIC